MNTLQYINYNENNKQNLRLGNIESKKNMLVETYREDFSTNDYIDIDNSNIIINNHGITTKNNKTKIIEFTDDITDKKNSVNIKNINGHVMLNPNQHWGQYVTKTIKTFGTKYVEINAEDKVFTENALKFKKTLNEKGASKTKAILNKDYIYTVSVISDKIIIKKLDKEFSKLKELVISENLSCQHINILSNDEYIIIFECTRGESRSGGDWFVYTTFLIECSTMELLDKKSYSTGGDFVITSHKIWTHLYKNTLYVRGVDSISGNSNVLYSIERNNEDKIELIEIRKWKNDSEIYNDIKILNDNLDIGLLNKKTFSIQNQSKQLQIDIDNTLKFYTLNDIPYIVTYDKDHIYINQLNISNDKIEVVNKVKYDAPDIQNRESFNLKLLENTIYMMYTVPQKLQEKQRTCTLIIDVKTNDSYFKINYKEYINGDIDISNMDNKLFLVESKESNINTYESENNRNNIKYFVSNDDGYTYHKIEPGQILEFDKVDDDLKIKIELSNFETVSPYVNKIILKQWSDEAETKDIDGIFLSKALPFYSRNKVGVLTADLTANESKIKWFISDNGGVDFEEVQLGIPFNLNQEFSTELKVKIEIKNDSTKSDIPVIRSYTLKTTAFVLQSQIETMQINLMKTNFKIDTFTNAASNELKNMYIDVFSNENNINKEISNCNFDAVNKCYSGEFVISNPIVIGRMKSRIMLTTEEILNKGSIDYYISGDSKNWYPINKEIPKSLNNILRRNYVMIKAVLKNNAKLSAWGIAWD